MTFRPPATKPTRRRTRQVDTRRAIFLNAAFGFASLAAVALLGGVLFANWYADHGVAVGSVGGVAISKDAVRAEAAVMQARYDRVLTDYDTLRNEGQLSTTDYGTVTSAITSAEDPTQLYSDALTQLQENLTLQQYADQHNISVTDADVDAQIVKDGTLPELRHVMVIGVVAAVTAPSVVPTSTQLDMAETQAQLYLNSITSGTQKWADVATEAESGGVASSTGDLGITAQSQLNLDPDFAQAIFDLKKVNDVTGLFLGTDGVYRFATVTAIVPPYVDSGWKDAVDSASNAGDYRNAARAEALKAVIQKSVESQYVSGPMVSRHVEEIDVSSGYSQLGDGPEAKIKMMIFAPNHDTSSASSVDASDPAWAEAKSRADAAYAALQKDITQFTKMALDTTNNDDPYVASQGGDLPWLPQAVFTGDASSQQGLGMQAVPSLIFAPNLRPGLLEPILEPTLGYVLVDFQGLRPGPAQRIADAQLGLNTGASFEAEAAKYSDASDAFNGGDMGWVTPYQLESDLQQAIFQAPIGGISRMVETSAGYSIFRVLAQETKTPDAAQQLKLKQVVFSSWLSDLEASTNTWTDSTGLTAITPTATP
jgi:parvulin-like peptidyl-prolyl isomerase